MVESLCDSNPLLTHSRIKTGCKFKTTPVAERLAHVCPRHEQKLRRIDQRPDHIFRPFAPSNLDSSRSVTGSPASRVLPPTAVCVRWLPASSGSTTLHHPVSRRPRHFEWPLRISDTPASNPSANTATEKVLSLEASAGGLEFAERSNRQTLRQILR